MSESYLSLQDIENLITQISVDFPNSDNIDFSTYPPDTCSKKTIVEVKYLLNFTKDYQVILDSILDTNNFFSGFDNISPLSYCVTRSVVIKNILSRI